MLGFDAHALNNIFWEIVAVLAAASFGQVDHDAFGDQLQKVAVASDDFDAQSFFFCPNRQAADDVISFVIVQFKTRDFEQVNHFLDAHNLLAQIVGHFFARGFVFLKEVIPKGAPFVKGDGKVIGLVDFKDFEQRAGKAKDARGGFAIGCGKAHRAATGQREIIAVSDGVSIE